MEASNAEIVSLPHDKDWYTLRHNADIVILHNLKIMKWIDYKPLSCSFEHYYSFIQSNGERMQAVDTFYIYCHIF